LTLYVTMNSAIPNTGSQWQTNYFFFQYLIIRQRYFDRLFTLIPWCHLERTTTRARVWAGEHRRPPFGGTSTCQEIVQ